MKTPIRLFTYGIAYNMMLITLGALIFGAGINGIVLPQGFISGGMTGLGMLIYYWTGWFTPGLLYLLLNVPLFILAWRYVSRRFFLYSLYGMAVLSLSMDLIDFTIPVQEPMLAVLAGGCLMGAGAGIIFHSLGSAGGNDVIGVILNQHFNVRIGTFLFVFNIALFALSLGRLPMDLVLYSLAMSFVTSQVLEYFLNFSNQRKMVLIISKQSGPIADQILSRMHRGVTLLEGRGGYTGLKKDVLMTVVHNLQLKRLEALVYQIDDQAFMIMGNTFNVLGKGFSKRKTY